MMPATLHNQSKIKLNSRELGYVVVSYNTTELVNLAVQMCQLPIFRMSLKNPPCSHQPIFHRS